MSSTLIDVHLKTLDILDKQLDRIFKEMGTFNSPGSAYVSLISQANTIITEITRLSRSIDVATNNTESIP
jgi:hypothetical protein